LEFQNNIKEIVDVDIFPSLEDIDIVDLLLFFNMSFGYTDNYTDIINDLISCKFEKRKIYYEKFPKNC
jgi:hypothetical protein